MKKKAIIISIKGYKLSSKEKLLLSKENPWGLILFKRNIQSFNQIKKLVKNIKFLTKDNKFPILIDEEGMKVSRLSNIFNNNLNADFFGKIYEMDKKISISIYKTYLRALCINLRKIGININTIPVLDVQRKNTHKILKKRKFFKKKEIVKYLGDMTIKECHSNNILTVMKHIPGHGCSEKDSHLTLPKVNFSEKYLNKIDFYPFKSSSSKLAMTAHILYSKIDAKNVSTFSKKIIDKIIRKKLVLKVF